MLGPMSQTQDLMGVTEHINLWAQTRFCGWRHRAASLKDGSVNPRAVLATEHSQFIVLICLSSF